jgi:hypothetical protein
MSEVIFKAGMVFNAPPSVIERVADFIEENGGHLKYSGMFTLNTVLRIENKNEKINEYEE